MAKAHPIELRERVVAHVLEGHTHRATAIHFKVSIKFVNDMVKLYRETGSLTPKPQLGTLGRGKLKPYKDWIVRKVEEQTDITLAELALELKMQFDVSVSQWGICQFLRKLGYSHKKRRFMLKSKTAQI